MTKIEDYAFLSDTQTCALVSRQGSIDWLCFPRFDSGACFAALLGDEKNGRWRIQADGSGDRYAAALSRRHLDPRDRHRDGVWGGAFDRFHAAARNVARHRADRGRGARERADADGPDDSLRLRPHRPVGAAGGWRAGGDRGAGCADFAHAGGDAGRGHADGGGLYGGGGRAGAVCPDLVPLAQGRAAADRPRACAQRHGELLARMVARLPHERPVARGGGAFAHYPERADLRADRRNRRRGHDFAAGGNRRRAQLGLPFLLAARCDA